VIEAAFIHTRNSHLFQSPPYTTKKPFFRLSKTSFSGYFSVGRLLSVGLLFGASLEAPQRAEKLVLVFGDPRWGPEKNCFFVLFGYFPKNAQLEEIGNFSRAPH
jgi:hypothetical protein